MDLDTRFGLIRPASAHGVKSWEWHVRPRSLIRFNPDLATTAETRSLLSFMMAAQAACLATHYLCGSVTIIWLVDGTGLIRLSIEEALIPNSRDETVPMLRHHRAGTAGLGKLGHPSLLDDDKRARIGGELLLRPDGTWELNNVSGRYGINCGRTVTQLTAVASVFSAVGLRIDLDFNG